MFEPAGARLHYLGSFHVSAIDLDGVIDPESSDYQA